MSNALGNSGGRFYGFGSQPVLIDCNFVVDSTNGNGRGIRSLKGQGVRNVFMHTTAAFTGTSHTSVLIDGISGGTSSLVAGMPVQGSGIPAGATIANIINSSSLNLSVATTTSTTGSITYQAVGNPNPAVGYALVHLDSSYNRYLGGFSGFASPTTGGTIAIDATDAALTVGNSYIIASVGHGPSGVATIAPVADVAGSLASKYFTLYDSYGNSFVIWFSVSGVGSPPNLGPAVLPGQRGLQYVQQAILSGAAATDITTALALTIPNLQSGIAGTFSFTVSGGGGATLTVTSTAQAPLAGIPQDGSSVIPDSGPSVPIIFTVSSASATAGAIYTDGSGHLYDVAVTLASGTKLQVTGVGVPIGSTLTKVSGTGDASITFSSAATGYPTGFTFAQTVSDTNVQDWYGVGVKKGIVPAVGVAFIATSTGAGGSTGLVIADGVSGIQSVEVVGDPNTSLSPQPVGGTPHSGGWILVKFMGPTNSSTTTPIPKAPAAGSIAGMAFWVDAKQSPSNIIAH